MKTAYQKELKLTGKSLSYWDKDSQENLLLELYGCKASCSNPGGKKSLRVPRVSPKGVPWPQSSVLKGSMGGWGTQSATSCGAGTLLGWSWDVSHQPVLGMVARAGNKKEQEQWGKKIINKSHFAGGGRNLCPSLPGTVLSTHVKAGCSLPAHSCLPTPKWDDGKKNFFGVQP